MNQQQFAVALLQRLRIPVSAGAVKALVGWQNAEGGHWHNQARFNPLNTTQPAAGAGNTGSQGNIKVYRNWNQGLDATVQTLRNGRYGGILNALRAGNPGRVAGAIGSSPWGTSAGLVSRTISGAHAGNLPAAGSTAAPSAPAPTRAAGSMTTRTQAPGVDNRQARAQLLQSFLSGSSRGSSYDPVGFALQFKSLADVPGATTTRTTTTMPGASAPPNRGGPPRPSGVHGPLGFEGKPVAGWIQPILKYARAQGWRGTVNSGYRSRAEQARIYNSGVRPAAVPGTSNHEFTAFPGGAVDVSDAAQLSAILKRSKYGHLLVWAGGKDPVHFSHPHGGSY